jgi:ketosteroid isomerase-like protein
MSSKIVNQIRAHYRAWDRSKGSTSEEFLKLMADDGSFRSIAAGAQPMMFTSDHSTKDKIREYFKGLEKDWEMLFYNVRTFLVHGNTVAVVCECAWKQKHTGKVVHTPKLDILRVKKGKITDFFEYFDNHQASAACSHEGVCTISPNPTPLYESNKPRTATGVTAAAANNVKALKKLYAQWHKTKGGSADALVDILAPSVLWGSLADGADPLAFTKAYKTREEVREYFRGLESAFTMNYYNVKEYLAGGPYVLVLCDISFTNKKTGKTFITPKADLCRFNRGKVTEFYEYYNTAEVIASAV